MVLPTSAGNLSFALTHDKKGGPLWSRMRLCSACSDAPPNPDHACRRSMQDPCSVQGDPPTCPEATQTALATLGDDSAPYTGVR